jgi:hypothetical protein
MEEKSKLRFHKEAFRTLLCGHLIPDLADIALDYFLVLMFVRIISTFGTVFLSLKNHPAPRPLLGTVLRGG